ncbi:hypothetical protein [Novipirellula sp.]
MNHNAASWSLSQACGPRPRFASLYQIRVLLPSHDAKASVTAVVAVV